VLALSCTPTGSRAPKHNSCSDGSQMLSWPISVTSASWLRRRTLPCLLLGICRTYCEPTHSLQANQRKPLFSFLFYSILIYFFPVAHSYDDVACSFPLRQQFSNSESRLPNSRLFARLSPSQLARGNMSARTTWVAGQCFVDYFRPFSRGLSKKSTFLDTSL
jgi:hypothetical protein